jgi:CubicO group peptidase (beta-lactamase class C family)
MRPVRAASVTALVVGAAACASASGATVSTSNSSAASSSPPSSAVASTAVPPTTVPAAGAHDATPEKVQAALPEFEKLVNDTMASTGLPGLAVAVVYRDQVVELKGYGVREVGKPDPVDPDTVFQLASISKPLSATVLAGLVGDKVITWDDRVADLDPSLVLSEPYVTANVTLRDMYAHRSGLPEYAGDLLEDMGYSREEILHRLRFMPLEDDGFRAQYAYTNFGITAAAAAKADGKVWEDLAKSRLYDPLGMTETSSRYEDYLAAADRAVGHVKDGDTWVAKYQRDPSTESPAGGASSSVRDLAQFMRLQLGNGTVDGNPIIDEAALAETHIPEMVSNGPAPPATDRAGFYGLGWNVSYDGDGRARWSHSGAFGLGAATNVNLLPAEQLGVVVLTNGFPIGVAEALTQSFLDLATTGKVQRDWVTLYQGLFAQLLDHFHHQVADYSSPPAQPSPPLANSAYVGTYDNDFYGPIQIVDRDGSLVMSQGPKPNEFPLRHWDRDTWLYDPIGESAPGTSGVTFKIGPTGTAVSVVVENLDVDHIGTFTREQAPPG